jgi:ribonucleoside-diphosphate reductase alpha chain
VPENYIGRVIQFARQGYKDLEFKTYDTDWDSEAYLTVSGQNSNNSVRLKDDFLGGRARRRLAPDRPQGRQGHEDAEGPRPVGVHRLRRLGFGRSGPALQHDDERLAHLPGIGAIRASNPCSEYMFLDDTACNLASLNLMQFRRGDGPSTSPTTSTPCGCGPSFSKSR